MSIGTDILMRAVGEAVAPSYQPAQSDLLSSVDVDPVLQVQQQARKVNRAAETLEESQSALAVGGFVAGIVVTVFLFGPRKSKR